MIIDAQESNRPGSLSRRGFDERAFWPQAREREAVSTTGLLDQGRVPQGLENACRVAPHIVFNREDKTGCQLSQRGSGTCKCWGIGEKFLAGQ